jgi:threonine dehydrogenase-like Zn-dependent dehydrogenase
MYEAGDVRIEHVPDPTVVEPTDAVVTASRAAICGSDLWPYPAPSRAYISELLPDVLEGRIDPGRVFDRTVTLDRVPDGYRAMHQREAIEVMVRP